MPRILYFLCGLFFWGLGIVGAFLPLLPTVPLLLLALFCFARSSKRFHDWLFYHPRWGPPLQAWQIHGVIPRRAKITAISMMIISQGILVSTTQFPSWLYIVVAIFLAAIALWMIRQPETPPSQEDGAA